MKAQLSRLLLVAVFGALAASCAGTATSPTRYAEQTSSKPVVHVELSWAEGYDNVADARAASDVVAVGTATKLLRSEESKATPGTVVSLFEINVSRVVKGKADETIVVKQDGGELSNLIAVVDDDPLLVPGTTYLMFLKAVKEGPYAGEYFMIGGSSGRLRVAADGSMAKVGGGILQPPSGKVDAVR